MNEVTLLSTVIVVNPIVADVVIWVHLLLEHDVIVINVVVVIVSVEAGFRLGMDEIIEVPSNEDDLD